jgi:preprotein translocase subunit YajC
MYFILYIMIFYFFFLIYYNQIKKSKENDK